MFPILNILEYFGAHVHMFFGCLSRHDIVRPWCLHMFSFTRYYQLFSKGVIPIYTPSNSGLFIDLTDNISYLKLRCC